MKKLLLFCVATLQLLAQPPPSTVHARMVVVNKNSSAINVQVHFYDSENGDAGSNEYPVNANGKLTQVLDFTTTSDTGQPYSAIVSAPSALAALSDSSYVVNESASGWRQIGVIPNPGTADEPYVGVYYVIQDKEVLQDGAKTVWAQGGSTLDGKLFREGIDKLIAQGNAPQSGDSGGGGTKYGTLFCLSAGVPTMTARGGDEVATTSLPIPSDETQAAAAATAVTAIRGVYEATEGLTELISVGSGSAPTLSVSLPSAFGGATFDMNPFTEERLGTPIAWFRTATLWLVYALLAIWIWEKIGEWTRGFASISQAKGNTVVAGTGAQGTALLAAGIMTAIFLTAATSLLGWGLGYLDIPSLITGVSDSPLATISSGVLWMLQQVFPVAAILACFVCRLSFQMVASSVFAACMTAVRFVVP